MRNFCTDSAMLTTPPSAPPSVQSASARHAPSPWPVPAAVRASVAVHVAAAGAAGAALLWPAGWAEAWPWAAGAVLLNHAGLSAAGLWPRSALLGPNISRLPAAAAARGDIAITIDDGPDPEVTPAVLDLLAEHGKAKATFFCIAERAQAHPALTRRIVAAGHSVQNHSLRHRHNFSLLGPRGFEREIGAAQAMLADITGVQPHCFRAPAGLRNPLLDPVLHRLGLHLLSWTRRGYDTRTADPALVLRRLTHGRAQGLMQGLTQRLSQGLTQRLSPGLSRGSILLLHDGHARRSAQGRAVLLDVLPALLQQCRAAGLTPVTLADALPPRQR